MADRILCRVSDRWARASAGRIKVPVEDYVAAINRGEKYCGGCRKCLPRTAEFFARASKNFDGLGSRCLACRRVPEADRKTGPRPPISEETRDKLRLSHLGKSYDRKKKPALKIQELRQGEGEFAGSLYIPLGRSGKFAIVDAADAPLVLPMAWHKVVAPHNAYASHSVIEKRRVVRRILMHRLIIGASDGEIVDHRNGNGLDNRRSNLRLCTTRENARNIRRSINQQRGGYKGVHWSKQTGRWLATVCAGPELANGRRRAMHVGSFTDQIAAAKAYDTAARKHFGEFAALNFPESPE